MQKELILVLWVVYVAAALDLPGNMKKIHSTLILRRNAALKGMSLTVKARPSSRKNGRKLSLHVAVPSPPPRGKGREEGRGYGYIRRLAQTCSVVVI